MDEVKQENNMLRSLLILILASALGLLAYEQAQMQKELTVQGISRQLWQKKAEQLQQMLNSCKKSCSVYEPRPLPIPSKENV